MQDMPSIACSDFYTGVNITSDIREGEVISLYGGTMTKRASTRVNSARASAW